MRRILAFPLVAAAALWACACSRSEKRPDSISAAEAGDLTRPAAEWLQLEPVRLLHEYVRIDTSPAHGEAAGAEFLRRFFECSGIDNEIVCPAPGRCNLLARVSGRRREGALLLLNHIDVVGAFAQMWNEAPPFEGRIQRGYLYGRGSYDMKSLGIAEALAMRDLKLHGIVPATDILFLAEADEESGQRWGSKWLLDHRPEWFRGVANVINEGGTDEMILRDVRFWGIETLEAGYGMLELEAGSPEALKQIAARFPRLSGPTVDPDPQVVVGFEMLANHLGHPLTDPLRHLDRVRRDPRELSILPDRYASFLEPRIFWATPYAFPPGQSSVFRSFVIVSTPPSLAPDPYLAPIERNAREHGIRVLQAESSGVTSASPYPTGFTDLLQRVVRARFPGVPFGPVPVSGGVTTSLEFRRRGFPTYGFSPVAMNAFDAARRHGNDERIYLRDYVTGVDLLREAVAEYAFFPPVSR